MAETLSLEAFELLSAADQVALRRFGRRVRLELSDMTLAAATPARVVTNNPNRLGLLIGNTGTVNPATITSDGDKTVAQGDVIGANGSAYELDALTDGEAVANERFGISTAGTTLHVEEIVAYGPVVRLPPGVTPL